MEALQAVGLLSRAGDRAAHLSHGEQQWLEIAMVVASNPEVILLDEPTAGMTHTEALRTAQLITALARQVMVLVVAHDMELVRHLQAPVTVMHLGQIYKQGALDEIRQDEAVQSIYLGKPSSAAR